MGQLEGNDIPLPLSSSAERQRPGVEREVFAGPEKYHKEKHPLGRRTFSCMGILFFFHFLQTCKMCGSFG